MEPIAGVTDPRHIERSVVADEEGIRLTAALLAHRNIGMPWNTNIVNDADAIRISRRSHPIIWPPTVRPRDIAEENVGTSIVYRARAQIDAIDTPLIRLLVVEKALRVAFAAHLSNARCR